MGYVYFAQARTTGRIKIGCTKNLWRRLSEIQTYSGDMIDLRAHMIDPDARATEAKLHKLFKPARLYGEWHDPHPTILGLIDLIRSKMEPATLEWYDAMQQVFIMDPPEGSAGIPDTPLLCKEGG